MLFAEEVNAFLRAAHAKEVRMLLVGGGAVNFHGYQRQSADIDFWIEPTPENFQRMLEALREMGFLIDGIPDKVARAEQNVSIKISPDMAIELITRFDPGRTFDEAWSRSELAEVAGHPVTRYRVLAYDDLVQSKLRSARPKDLLDVQELQRRKGGPTQA